MARLDLRLTRVRPPQDADDLGSIAILPACGHQHVRRRDQHETASEPLSARRGEAGCRSPALELEASAEGDSFLCSRASAHPHGAIAAATAAGRRRRIERVGKLRQSQGDVAQRGADGRQGRLYAGTVNWLHKAASHACARLGALPKLDGAAQLPTRLESRNDIEELVAALFAVAGQGDDRGPDRAGGVNRSTNGQVPLVTRP